MANRFRFPLLVRLCMRSGEIAGEQGMAEEVVQVYDDLLAPAAAAFCASHEAVATAQTQAAKSKLMAAQTLVQFDPTYRATRSVVLAYEPGTVLPDTLKAHHTDTDVLFALASLVKVVKTHAGEAWAGKLMAGRFGTCAPEAEAVLKASIAAGIALAMARKARAEASVPAYHRFLAFKRVVRDTLGASSVYYRRLHPRGAASNAIDSGDEEAAPDSGVMAASGGDPAQVNGPSHVKIG